MRSTYVPPSGPMNAKIAIIGDQPGVTEIRQGKCFTGPAGKALNSCLFLAKIMRSECYFTNVIKDLDRPLSHYIDITAKGSSISKDGNTYINELSAELKRLQNLTAVIALGNVPLVALTNRTGITKWRGSVIESTVVQGLKVIPTVHPSTFIPPKFNYLNKPLLVEDLTRAKHESQFREIRKIDRKVIIEPSYERSINALSHCYKAGLKGQILDIDIEVINGEVDCFAIAWSPTQAICIPLRCSKGNYFTLEQEYRIMLFLALIIEHEMISIRGANFIFDTQFFLHKYGIRPRGHIHCTQIAQKISFPDYNAGLDFVTNMHTDIPYYKADGKQWMKMGIGTWDQW